VYRQAVQTANDQRSRIQASLQEANGALAVVEAELERALLRPAQLHQKLALVEKMEKAGTATTLEVQTIRAELQDAEAQAKVVKARREALRAQIMQIQAEYKALEPATQPQPPSGTMGGTTGANTKPVQGGNMIPAPNGGGGSQLRTAPAPTTTASGTTPLTAGAAMGLTREAKTEPALLVLSVKHVQASELGRVMQEVFRDGPTAKIKVVVDANSNSLILSGTPEAVETAKTLIERLDVERVNRE
jgi:type II secretory pathway component GspD/PulD (secretin)